MKNSNVSTNTINPRGADSLDATEFAVIAHLEEAITDAARSDLDVMLTGGTARLRRLLARLIHRRSERDGDPFAVVQPHELERSLLGRRQAGLRPGTAGSERAPAGSAFVEDIGDLRADTQTRLLRLLDRRAAQRTKGDTRSTPRLLVGTGHSLQDRVESGHFSRELFYRLNTIHITLPSLRAKSGNDQWASPQ